MRRGSCLVAAVLSLALPVFVLGLSGCGQASSSSTSSSPASSPASDSTTTVSVPSGEAIEIYRFGEEKKLWQAWISGDYVVWMESAGPVSGSGLGYSGPPDWDTVFRYVPIGGGDVREAPDSRLLAPNRPRSGPYGLTIPLSWAAVLSQGPGKPYKLVWAAPPEKLGETYFFRGLSSWSPGRDQVEVLPQSALSFHAQVSGDAIAIPVPASSYTSSDGDYDPRNWEKLLMMTGNMRAPVQVDPEAPKLPASALSGLSPYFGLLTVEPSGRGIVSIYDLRTGKKLAFLL